MTRRMTTPDTTRNRQEASMTDQTAEQQSVPIEVTARDPQSGDSDTMTIRNDYCIVTAGAAEVTGVQVHHKSDGTQTHVITVKGVRRG